MKENDLFGCRRKAVVLELRFKAGLLGARLLDVLFLDVTIAPDHLRDSGKPREMRNLLGFQGSHALLDHGKIVLDQPALGLALGGASERIVSRAAQEFQPCQQTEGVDHPAAERRLPQVSRYFVAAGEDRRREIEFEMEVAV